MVSTFVADGMCPIVDRSHLIGGQPAGVPEQRGGLGCVQVYRRVGRGQVDAGQRCTCRECQPGRSGGMIVLVEDAGEAVMSMDVQVSEQARFGDRLG